MEYNNLKIIHGDIFSVLADAILIPRTSGGQVSSYFVAGLNERYGYHLSLPLPFSKPGQIDKYLFENRVTSHKSFIFLSTPIDSSQNSVATFSLHIGEILSLLKKETSIGHLVIPLEEICAGTVPPAKLAEIIYRLTKEEKIKTEISVYLTDGNQLRDIITSSASWDSGDGRMNDQNPDPVSLAPPKQDELYVFEWDAGTEEFPGANKEDWSRFFGKNAMIANMQVGRAVLLKTYRIEGQQHQLIVHAAGIVTKNPGEAGMPEISWLLKDITRIIHTTHPYQNRVMRIGKQHAPQILNSIGEWPLFLDKQSEKAGSENEIAYADSSIATIQNDAEQGTDYLDIGKDYSAFARIIASKDFTPPLSIAIFGKWGSGKSFFMNKLDAQISDYALSGSAETYCKGIVQIHFNAWSYMDANLWASLVSRIFEELYGFISVNGKADEKQKISDSLNEQLIIASEEISTFENERNATSEKIAALNKQRKGMQESLTAKIEEIKNISLESAMVQVDKDFKVVDELSSVIKNDDSVIADVEQIKKAIPTGYLQDPRLAYNQAKSVGTFLRDFCRNDKILLNIAVLITGVLLLWLMPHILVFLKEQVRVFILPVVQTVLFLTSIVLPLYKRYESTINRVSVLVFALYKVKENYLMKIESAKIEVIQKEKAIKLEIGVCESRLETIEQQLFTQNENLKVLKYKLNHALATQTLYSFIEKRCNSDEYQKHLGIVSIVRKDFDTLSRLFVDHHQEVKNTQAEEFRKLFDKPLDRIVLYIDDLDRCPQERVVEVLEAVNLLMAFPLFVVVVGVDPGWINQSLSLRYAEQFKQGSGITVSDYLEKIFQIPFHLKQAEDGNVKHMLQNLIGEINEYEGPSDEQFKQAGADNSDSAGEVSSENNPIIIPQNFAGSVRLQKQEVPLILSAREAENISHFSHLVGNNPRSIKRFINLYKVIRAHESLNYNFANRETEFTIIMFLLTIYHGKHKHFAPILNKYLNNPLNENMNGLLSASFGGSYSAEEKKVAEILSLMPIGLLLRDESIETFRKQNNFIKRFTFENQAATLSGSLTS